jgi:hypothetical protein
VIAAEKEVKEGYGLEKGGVEEEAGCVAWRRVDMKGGVVEEGDDVRYTGTIGRGGQPHGGRGVQSGGDMERLQGAAAWWTEEGSAN